MDFSIIIKPLIGAGIGYVTNWIAVKMMFRPLNPIKIGNYTLPFTPGIIPKNKERLAESIGNSISENLLTDEALSQALLSEDIKEKVKQKIIDVLNSSTENTASIESTICKYIGDISYNNILENIISTLTSNIHTTVIKADLGNIVAEQIKISAQESFKGSMLGLLGGNALVTSIANTASLKTNYYIEKNGKELISDMVKSEINKYTNYTISDITTQIGNSNIDLVSILMNMYEKFVITELSDILETINISNIIKNKINEMNVLDLEKMILQIMKKELNALVNLGAIIGFILGLLNLLF